MTKETKSLITGTLIFLFFGPFLWVPWYFRNEITAFYRKLLRRPAKKAVASSE